MKSRRAIGEFDQGEIEAFAIGYWGFERKCIPDNRSDRECTLVSRRFDSGAIIDRAACLFEKKARLAQQGKSPNAGAVLK